MDFGCVFFANPEAYKDAALAEKMGFTHGWLYDSQMLGSDVYAALALCAVNTRRLIIGPGVTNPLSRIAPVTACAMATINALAPGRAVLGIGTGNTARRTLGMPAARVDQLREHIEICRGLLKRPDRALSRRRAAPDDPFPQSRRRLYQHSQKNPDLRRRQRDAQPGNGG